MLKKDNVFFGLAIGLILPGLGWLIVQVLQKNFQFFQKFDLLYIGCIAINLLMVKYSFNHDKERTARGIVSATFLCAFLFFYYKVRQ